MEKVKAKSYTLKTKSGHWLGQIIITNDGSFMSITDFGNFNFAWRHYGDKDFRQFLVSLDLHYFSGKMFGGNVYIHGMSKKIEKAALRFSEEILPVFQEMLKKELEENVPF